MTFLRILWTFAFGLASPAFADLAPLPSEADGQSDPELVEFDGSCKCVAACNGTALTYYEIQYKVKLASQIYDVGDADLACREGADEARGVKSLKQNVTAKTATALFCRFGGNGVAACPLGDDACGLDRIECYNAQFPRGVP